MFKKCVTFSDFVYALALITAKPDSVFVQTRLEHQPEKGGNEQEHGEKGQNPHYSPE